MSAVLSCNGISKTYRGFQLSDVSFQIETGYLTGLVGANGAGKTTLLRILAGLDGRYEGTVAAEGISLESSPNAYKNQIGYVSENIALFQEKNLMENGELLGKYYDCWSMEEYYYFMDRMQLKPGLGLHQLSKGEKMKFLTCFAMAHKPKFLILDEPTAGFDPVFRMDFLKILQDIMDRDVGILMSTHITEDLDKIADYILVLQEGRLSVNKSLEDLQDLAKVLHPQTAFNVSGLLSHQGGDEL